MIPNYWNHCDYGAENESTGIKECAHGTINPYYANTLYLDDATKKFWRDQSLVAESFDTTEYEKW